MTPHIAKVETISSAVRHPAPQRKAITAPLADLLIARRAAAIVSAADGWMMDDAYLSGLNDDDADVRAALAAIAMIRGAA
jgi:hypothetical protein